MNLKLLMVIDVKNDEKLYTYLLKKYKVKFKAMFNGSCVFLSHELLLTNM